MRVPATKKVVAEVDSDSDDDHHGLLDLSGILSNYNSSLTFDATHFDTSNVIAGSKTELLITSMSPKLDPTRQQLKAEIVPIDDNDLSDFTPPSCFISQVSPSSYKIAFGATKSGAFNICVSAEVRLDEEQRKAGWRAGRRAGAKR